MNDPRVEKQKPVPPFVQFCCAAIPQVFDDSLSYYEALCAMWKYLNDTVNVINNNAMITEDFIAKVNELHDYVEHYFDNLDVQEEINNKLDAMADDGTLQEIITTYIQANVAWTFDTVADMKTAENFIDGSYARTLGFHAVNDGGAALYKVRTVTNDDVVDEASIIELADDTLVAEYIHEDKGFLNVNKFGLTDQLYMNDYWSKIYNYALAKGCYIYFPTGTYKVKKTDVANDYIFAGNFISMEGKNATILCESSVDSSTDLFKFTGIPNAFNQFIKGIKFDTATNDYSEVRYFLHFVFSDLKLFYNLQIENNTFMKSSSYAIYTLGNATTGGFNNCKFNNNEAYGLFISSASYGDSNKICGNNLYASETAQLGDYPIKLTQTNGSSGCIVANNNCSGGLGSFTDFYELLIDNNQIENVHQTLDYLIYIYNGANIKIQNCNLNAHSNSDLIYTRNINTVIDNCIMNLQKTYTIVSYAHLTKVHDVRWYNGSSWVTTLDGSKVSGECTSTLYSKTDRVYYVDNELNMHIKPSVTSSIELSPYNAEADATYPYYQPVESTDGSAIKFIYHNNQFYVRTDALLNSFAVFRIKDF